MSYKLVYQLLKGSNLSDDDRRANAERVISSLYTLLGEESTSDSD